MGDMVLVAGGLGRPSFSTLLQDQPIPKASPQVLPDPQHCCRAMPGEREHPNPRGGNGGAGGCWYCQDPF